MFFSYLAQEDIQAVHQASLRVLAEVGILLDDPEARSILMDHGAQARRDLLCLPAQLVEDCLQRCPPVVLLRGRGSQVELGSGKLFVHNMGGARDVQDHPGADLRPAASSDVAQSARLLDALSNVDTVTPLYTPRDVPGELMVLTMFDQTLRSTLKPVNGPGVRNVQEARWLIEMMKVVFGDHPAVSMGASPVSPLNFTGDLPQVMFAVARAGLPFGPLPCPSVGATAPMSLAGALVQQNAEVLASLVLVQLAAPGAPLVYCGRLSVLNMRSGAPIWGNPEVGMMSAATVQLAHYYHLPVNVYGLADSGYAADMQGGYERAINALVPALAGADELSGVGEMAGGVCSANYQMVIDDDIFGMLRRILRGFQVDEHSLAVDVIAHAMATSHNFLAEKHSRHYLRQGEVWSGRLGLHESGWDQWRDAGSPTVLQRAQAASQEILATHQVPPLPLEQARALDEIMSAAARQAGVAR